MAQRRAPTLPRGGDRGHSRGDEETAHIPGHMLFNDPPGHGTGDKGTTLRFVLILTLATVLAACGGGSGDIASDDGTPSEGDPPGTATAQSPEEPPEEPLDESVSPETAHDVGADEHVALDASGTEFRPAGGQGGEEGHPDPFELDRGREDCGIGEVYGSDELTVEGCDVVEGDGRAFVVSTHQVGSGAYERREVWVSCGEGGTFVPHLLAGDQGVSGITVEPLDVAAVEGPAAAVGFTLATAGASVEIVTYGDGDDCPGVAAVVPGGRGATWSVTDDGVRVDVPGTQQDGSEALVTTYCARALDAGGWEAAVYSDREEPPPSC